MRAAFIGKTLDGHYGNSVTWTETYYDDGHLDYRESQRRAAGSWHFRGHVFCTCDQGERQLLRVLPCRPLSRAALRGRRRRHGAALECAGLAPGGAIYLQRQAERLAHGFRRPPKRYILTDSSSPAASNVQTVAAM
jgi:hypothetical protein